VSSALPWAREDRVPRRVARWPEADATDILGLYLSVKMRGISIKMSHTRSQPNSECSSALRRVSLACFVLVYTWKVPDVYSVKIEVLRDLFPYTLE
jgi:hypothetical protein